MKRKPITLLLSLFFGIAAVVFLSSSQADSNHITFEPSLYSPGSPHNQDGWSSSGSAGSGCANYDHAIVNGHPAAPGSFGSQSLRMSNAVTSGCFGDQTFSKSLTSEAGEASAQNGGMSGGVRQNFFEAEWQFASTVPGAEQPGLSVVASPDRGDGARMSWVQMTDTPTGLAVNFFDYQSGAVESGCTTGANFISTNVASGLARNIPHTIKLTMNFFPGPANDVVRVYVDGVLVHTGTSWEDYFRECESNPTRTVDSVLFRTGGAAAPATAGNGFLIDNLSLNTGNDADTDGDADSTTVVVSPADTNGWGFVTEIPNGSGGFEQGEGAPPLGTGSAFLTVDATGRQILATAAYNGTRLDQISELRYSSYQNGNTNTVVAPSLQLQVDYNLTDANNTFQGRLVFEPYQIPAAVQQNVWQTWHPLAGRWWASNTSATASNGNCPQSNPCTWQQVLTLFPNAGIHSTLGALLFRAGGPWAPGFDGNVDAFTIGVGTTFTTYDFEADRDGDGYLDTNDCDPFDQAINPGATEVCNGVDDDCDTLIDEGVQTTFYADDDNDGFGDASQPLQACSTPPGYVANDDDCDDTDGTVYPGAPELCDGKDNDCDGLTDEGFPNTDGDGFADCVDTDDDNDGVLDANDLCPATPSGTVVNTFGCPLAVNKDQCKNNGWMNVRRANNTKFKNQGDCIQYVNTGK